MFGINSSQQDGTFVAAIKNPPGEFSFAMYIASVGGHELRKMIRGYQSADGSRERAFPDSGSEPSCLIESEGPLWRILTGGGAARYDSLTVQPGCVQPGCTNQGAGLAMEGASVEKKQENFVPRGCQPALRPGQK